MASLPTVTSIIGDVFPYIPRHRIQRIAKIIVSACDDYLEATDIAYKIPRQTWGTFRFDVNSKQWVKFYNSCGCEIDH